MKRLRRRKDLMTTSFVVCLIVL
ncbi:hypothetical protein Golax_022490 [Gossypium laxum]|uniref:Uncharacterized protein n=1 Tax=Gossypium laxum TaxID=34288 RepID=A0A7J9B079_9ROSI|nr:hypothetical protein [Gossypium laxum]